jgi:hypothetical protein
MDSQNVKTISASYKTRKPTFLDGLEKYLHATTSPWGQDILILLWTQGPVHVNGEPCVCLPIDLLRNKFRDWRLGMFVFPYRMWIDVVSSSGGYKNISIWSSGSLLLALKWKCPENCVQFCKKQVFTRHIPQNANFLSITYGCHYMSHHPLTHVHWRNAHYTTWPSSGVNRESPEAVWELLWLRN